MPVIEIDCPGGTGMGTVIKADGHELPLVRSIKVDIGLDEPVTATVEMLAGEAFKFKTDARLVINVVAGRGWRIVSRPCSDGWEYTAEPELVLHP